MSGEFPRDVVVRLATLFGIFLWSEEINSVIAIGLIETDDIGSGGIGAVLELNGRLRAADFDVLAHEAGDELRDACGVALVGRNEESVGGFLETLAIGVKAFGIEILEENLGIGGGVVESGERAAFRCN